MTWVGAQAQVGIWAGEALELSRTPSSRTFIKQWKLKTGPMPSLLQIWAYAVCIWINQVKYFYEQNQQEYFCPMSSKRLTLNITTFSNEKCDKDAFSCYSKKMQQHSITLEIYILHGNKLYIKMHYSRLSTESRTIIQIPAKWRYPVQWTYRT